MGWPKRGAISSLDEFQGQEQLIARPFLLLCICQQLMRCINPSSSWSQRLTHLLEGFPDLQHVGLTLQGMGIAEPWLHTCTEAVEPTWKQMLR